MKRKIIFLLAAIMLISAAAAFGSLQKDKKAPDFTLPVAGNSKKKVKLSNSFKNKGNVVVVNFWATWCGYCVKEIPEFVDVNAKYKGKAFKMIGVAADEDEKDVVRFAKANKMTYTLLMDPNSKTCGKSYQIDGYPTTYVIDKKGVIKASFVGYMDSSQIAQMEKIIDELLKK